MNNIVGDKHVSDRTDTISEYDYNHLFEQLDVAVWRQDISGIFFELDKLRRSGVDDITSYLDESVDNILNIAMRAQILQVNPAALKLLEADSEEYLLENMHTTFTESTVDFFYKMIVAIWNGEEHFSNDLTVRTLKGAVVNVLLSFRIPQSLEDSFNTPFSLVDITQQKKNECSLLEKERLSTALVENANISIWNGDFSAIYAEFEKFREEGVKDLRAYFREDRSELFRIISLVKIIHANSTSVRMFEADSEKNFIANIRDTFTADGVNVIEKELGDMWDGKERFSAETTFLSFKGRELHGIISFNIPRDISESQNVPITILDITEKKKMEEQLHQSEKMQVIGQLAGGIAHDFNNQLGGILGFADLLHQKVEEIAPELKEYTSSIISGIRRASDLTSELLAFSRKGKYRSEVIDVHSIIDEVTTILLHTLDKRIVIERNYCLEQATISGDATQLQNALLNLALNARDALDGGGSISFTTEIVTVSPHTVDNLHSGTYLTIQISDTGMGMSKDIQEHIFEPFFTTKEMGKGTGMGLAAVYGTIQHHGGTITVASEPQKGSSFTLYFPYTCDVTPAENIKVVEHSKKVSANILLIDDEPVLRNVASRMVKSMGYTITTCGDGLEALDYLENCDTDIDLIILDLIMPGLSGTDTFHILKDKYPDINILISSGYSIEGEAEELIDKGANGFIQKPFTTEELAFKIHEIFSLEKS